MMRPLCQNQGRPTHRVGPPTDVRRAYSSPMTTRSHKSDDTGGSETTPETAVVPVDDSSSDASAPATRDASGTGRGRQANDAVPDSAAGRLGSAWVGLVLGALVTILLLIFIAQNTTATEVQYLGLHFSLPLGVLILFAAIAGALIMALFAGFRILQLRMRARRARKVTR